MKGNHNLENGNSIQDRVVINMSKIQNERKSQQSAGTLDLDAGCY